MDIIERNARMSEEQFREWFEATEPYLHLYTTRMIWDIAFGKGMVAGMEEFKRLTE